MSASANLGRGYTGYFAGDIAEVLVYTRALSTAERQAVEQYLLAKYINVSSGKPGAHGKRGIQPDHCVSGGRPLWLRRPATTACLRVKLAVNWSVISGPAEVIFSDATSATSRATFSAPGSYALKVTVSDGSLSTSDDLTVEVVAAHASVPEEASHSEPEETMPAPSNSSVGAKTYATKDYIYPSDSGYFNVKDEPTPAMGMAGTTIPRCIKAAMDAAMHVGPTAGRHATVYFPEGTYLISDTLLWATVWRRQRRGHG